jgi:nitroreductase
MEFADVVKTRTSIRTFQDKPVEDDKLIYVLDAARRAPSEANKQCWRYIIIKDPDTKKQIAKHSIYARWIHTAPVVIVACADTSDAGTYNNQDYYLVDVAISLEHLVLAATDVGLGTCWVAGFNEEKIKELLTIPKRIRVVALTPLGYPADNKRLAETIAKSFLKADRRKSLDELVHYDHW